MVVGGANPRTNPFTMSKPIQVGKKMIRMGPMAKRRDKKIKEANKKP